LTTTLAGRGPVLLAAIRPQFFLAIVLPVLLGTAVAWRETHVFHPLLFLLALLAAVLCHAGANVINDYFDFRSGADNLNPAPLSPYAGGSRMIQRGLLTPRQIYIYGLVLLSTAVLIGLVLVAITGAPLLAIGLLGVASAWLYSAPPIAINYRGLGEVLIGLNFGVLPVLGACYVQVRAFPASALAASLPIAFLASEILYVNQFPDYAWDKAAGKRTLVVALGRERGVRVYPLFAAAALLCVVAAVASNLLPPASLLALAAAAPVWLATRALEAAGGDSARMMPAIRITIAVHAFVGMVLILAVLLG
jgi:1,4-dihydroxy-2-naphthoate octaprenyltransferase